MQEILEKQEKSRESVIASDSMQELVRIARASRIAQMAMVAGEAKLDADEIMINEQLEIANKTLMEIKESLKSSLSAIANREFTSPEAKELAKESVMSGSYLKTGWETFKDKATNTKDVIVGAVTNPIQTLSDLTLGSPEGGSIRGNKRAYNRAENQYVKDRSDAYDAVEGTVDFPNPSRDVEFIKTAKTEFKKQQEAGREVQEAESEMLRRDGIGISRTHPVNVDLNAKFDAGMEKFAANDPLKIGIMMPQKVVRVVEPEKEPDASEAFKNTKENRPDFNNMAIGLQLVKTQDELDAENLAAKKEERNRKKREKYAADRAGTTEEKADVKEAAIKETVEKASLKENQEQTKTLKVIAEKLVKASEEADEPKDDKESGEGKGIIDTLLDGLKGIITSLSGLGKIATMIGGIASASAALGARGVGALAGSAGGIAAMAGGVVAAGAAGYGVGTAANWIAEKTTGRSLSDRLLDGYEKLTGENYGVKPSDSVTKLSKVPNETGNKVAMASSELAGVKDSKAPIIVSAPSVSNLSSVSNGNRDKPMGSCRNPDSISDYISSRYSQYQR